MGQRPLEMACVQATHQGCAVAEQSQSWHKASAEMLNAEESLGNT